MTKTRNSTYNTLIMREVSPLPIPSCRINITSSGDTTPALLHRSMIYCGRVFLCLCLIIPTLFFASCESYDDPSHLLMKDYFEESQGLSQASTDSVARFSKKVNEFTTRIPEAKNDQGFYLKNALNDETDGYCQTCELNKDPDAEEPCSWGSFYLQPEEWNPGYYDFVFLNKNKVFATMLTRFYKPDELLEKSDSELEKLMKK